MNKRLLSLDILRGFDLFLLVFFQPVFVALAHTADIGWLNSIAFQFDHEVWEGFRCWDLVMPLFLFMAGVSMPFSFEKYHSAPPKRIVWRILKRVLLLYLLGGIVQGNFLGFNPQQIYLYSNTLQSIAAGYLISSIILLCFRRKGQIISFFVLMLLYWLPMTIVGDYTPDGNLAEKIDMLILGRFRDGAYWDGAAWQFSNYHYTWILSSLNFGATVMLGAFSGEILKETDNKKLNLMRLSVFGAVLVATGLLLSFQMPIIKRIWSSSMTLYSGGLCVLLLALFYFFIDYKKWSFGLKWLTIYGTNSITAYVLGEAVNFRSIVRSLLYGLEAYTGDYYQVIVTFGNYFMVFIILFVLHKRKIFIKI